MAALRFAVLVLCAYLLPLSPGQIVAPGPQAGIVLKERPGLLITNCAIHTQRVFLRIDPRAIYQRLYRAPSTEDREMSFSATQWTEQALSMAESAISHQLANLGKFVDTQSELAVPPAQGSRARRSLASRPRPRQRRFIASLLLAASALGSLFSLGTSSFNAVSLNTVRNQVDEIQNELPHLRDLVLTQSKQSTALAQTVRGTLVVLNAHSETLNKTARMLSALQNVVYVDYAHTMFLNSLVEELLRDFGSSAESLAQGRIPPYLVPISMVQNILASALGGAVSETQAHLAFSLGSTIPLHVDPVTRELAFLLSLPVIKTDSIYRLKSVLNVGSWQGSNLVRVETPEMVAYHDTNPGLYLAPSLQLCKLTKSIHYVCQSKPFIADSTSGICGLKAMTLTSKCRATVTPRYQVHDTRAIAVDHRWLVTSNQNEARLSYPAHDTLTRMTLPNQTMFIQVPKGAILHIGSLALYHLGSEEEMQAEVELSSFYHEHKFQLDPTLEGELKHRGQQVVSLAPVDQVIHALSTLDHSTVPVFTHGWSGIEAFTLALVCLGFATVSPILCSICRRLQVAQRQINLILKTKGSDGEKEEEEVELNEQPPGKDIFRLAPKLRLGGPPTV